MRPEDGKKVYDQIEIPKELELTVRRSVEEAARRREARRKEEAENSAERDRREEKDLEKRGPERTGLEMESTEKDPLTEKQEEKQGRQRQRKNGARSPIYRLLRRTAAAAAGVLIAFTVGLNTNQAFAENMSRVPGLGFLASVLTVRSYHESEGDYNIHAEVPGIMQSQEETGNRSLQADKVNEEIERIADSYMAEAKAEFEEYKEAFFAAGGTEEEWNNRQMNISIDYEVKYQDEAVLSLELTAFKGWINASEERHYYNLDLSEDRELTLQDVLGSGYAELCNKEVMRQIEERMAADENQIFFGFGRAGDMAEGFTTVDENTDFYISGTGEVVLVFPEYSIAPGYMGTTEFTVGPMVKDGMGETGKRNKK